MGWRSRAAGPRPGEAEQIPHRRADWRLLLPGGQPARVALLGLGPAANWSWLVDDGWTAAVTVELSPPPHPVPNSAVNSVPLDVVVIGPTALADEPGLLDRAVDALGPDGAVVVLGGRHRRVVRSLRRLGVGPVRRYLAFPDALAPSRLVPLDHPGGLAWLAGPPPARPEARLPVDRRLLRAVLLRVGGVIPEPFGDVVVVGCLGGSRGAGAGAGDGDGGSTGVPLGARLHDTDPNRTENDVIVITSGFDEGSRSVVLPLAGSGPPRAVVKVVARPAYRVNAEREHELLGRLSVAIDAPGLVPTPLASFEVDGTVAVVESYAGRWTASAVLAEQRSLSRRSAVLDAVMDRLVDLASVGASSEAWNADGFESLIGRWFDRLDEIEGPSPARQELRSALRDRSDALEGRDLAMGLRHFDLGPWNVVFADRDPDRTGVGPAITVVDWELAEPRTSSVGPAGADHLYFTKYWLHIAQGCDTLDAEQRAFAFLAPPPPLPRPPLRNGEARPPRRWAIASQNVLVPGDDDDDPRALAKAALVEAARSLGLDVGFLPLLEAHLWSEAACYTAQRRRGRGGDGGSPSRYLATLAEHRAALLEAWPS